MSFLLLGQTDAGKSTIAGHLLHLVGVFEKVNHELGKHKYSILLDTCEEEQESGKTKTHDYSYYDFEYAPANSSTKNYTLIDTPGHLLYIRTLINGLYNPKGTSGKIDLIVLVISSISDEFESSFNRGTVKEDLLLARSVGCSNLLVAWNKTDIVEHSKEHEKQIHDWAKKLHYKTINHLNVSGMTGQNLLEILKYIPRPINEIISEEKKLEITSDKIRAKVAIYLPSEENMIISAGFICILHHKSGEYEVEICKMISTQKNIKFIRDSGTTCTLFCICKGKNIIYSDGDKIILRKNKFTIGYGILN
jgi:sulfate adenylyltransferase subunit 1 (EFTu-like GTPase family)